MQNFEVALAFRELADLLEFKGEDFFKVRAYRRAAKIIAGLDEPAGQLLREGKLAGVPGIGKNILAKIWEIVTTGSMRKLTELQQEFPSSVLEIMDLPSIGPKKARVLYQHLKVASLDELEREAQLKHVRKLPGLGAKTELDIIRNIQMLRVHANKVLLGVAREITAGLVEYLKDLPEVKKVEPTGSIRRWRETVGDIDLLVLTGRPEILLEFFVKHPRVKQVLVREENRIKVITWWGVTVELFTAPEEEFWTTLLWSTGCREHYRELQLLARQKGLDLSPRAFVDRKGKPINIQSEEDIYRRLGLPFIPPELRENKGEIGYCLKEGGLPRIIQVSDLKGDLHIHSNWSDGVASVEQIVEHARKKGYKYIAITDHSHSLKIAKGLSREQQLEQRRLIAAINEKQDDVRVLWGIEVDILPNGKLDCPDDLLEQMDIVIASVHSHFRQDRETMTARILSAVQNKQVHIIGHLTGRLIGQREGYSFDVERIFEAATRQGKFLEINSSPDRLDLSEENARLAKEYGIKMAINTDAHDLRRMEEAPYGVAVARRAWLEPGDVINTFDLHDLLRILAR